jgi:hypothetical protein
MTTGWPKKAGMRACLFVAGHRDLTGKISGDRGALLFRKSAAYQFSYLFFTNLSFANSVIMKGGKSHFSHVMANIFMF